LALHGRKKRPFYRIVVADSRSPRDGRHIEIVGTYDPIANKEGVKDIRFNSERIQYWLSVGAQPSDRVGWLFGKFGILPERVNRYSPQRMVPKAEREEEKRGFCTQTCPQMGKEGMGSSPDVRTLLMINNIKLAPLLATIR